MQVVILCGGQGTRLREETEIRPKPMVEIGGRPILWHIMKIVRRPRDSTTSSSSLGYKGDMIKEYFLNYEVHEQRLHRCELGERAERPGPRGPARGSRLAGDPRGHRASDA